MATDLLWQLNDDVWHPDRLAYGQLNAQAFLDLHLPELIRAGGPAKQGLWFTELAGRGSSVSISSRFIERIAACRRTVARLRRLRHRRTGSDVGGGVPRRTERRRRRRVQGVTRV